MEFQPRISQICEFPSEIWFNEFQAQYWHRIYRLLKCTFEYIQINSVNDITFIGPESNKRETITSLPNQLCVFFFFAASLWILFFSQEYFFIPYFPSVILFCFYSSRLYWYFSLNDSSKSQFLFIVSFSPTDHHQEIYVYWMSQYFSK